MFINHRNVWIRHRLRVESGLAGCSDQALGLGEDHWSHCKCWGLSALAEGGSGYPEGSGILPFQLIFKKCLWNKTPGWQAEGTGGCTQLLLLCQMCPFLTLIKEQDDWSGNLCRSLYASLDRHLWPSTCLKSLCSPVCSCPTPGRRRQSHHSWRGGWGTSLLDPIRQRKALEHMDPNVWSKHNSLVSVLQGDFYQHCSNNSSLPEGLMGLVLLVLIDLGWRPAFEPSSATEDLGWARALKRRFIRESHD